LIANDLGEKGAKVMKATAWKGGGYGLRVGRQNVIKHFPQKVVINRRHDFKTDLFLFAFIDILDNMPGIQGRTD
jgi:hypothetical protein